MFNKVLAYMCALASVIWFVEAIMYVMGAFEPKPLTIGVALFFTGVLMAKLAYENLQNG